MGTSFCSLANSDGILQISVPKKYYSQQKFLDFLHRTEISAILGDFCLNLVAMATPIDPFMNSGSIFEFADY